MAAAVLFFTLGAAFASLLWPQLGVGLPSLKEVVEMLEHPSVGTFGAMLSDAWHATSRGAGHYMKAAVPIGLALLYLAIWIPYGKLCLRRCVCARPLVVADIIVDAADPDGCTCVTFACCGRRLVRADRKRSAELRRITRHPLAQLYAVLFAMCGAGLIIMETPRLSSVTDADGNGVIGLFDAVEHVRAPALSASKAALAQLNHNVLPAAEMWAQRVRCEAANITETQLQNCPLRKTAPLLPRAHSWDTFSRAALASTTRGALPLPPSIARCDGVDADVCSANDADAAAPSVETFRARAAVTARRAFVVACVANVAFALHLALRSTLRIPIALVLVFAIDAVAPREHAASTGSMARWIERTGSALYVTNW